jgi:secondary thiamine-phosphate synthase enzyme|tara:strand:- start:1034 stop:1549 length:516 start_codon:yes stop_codon:yes gene_type:complete
MPWSQFELTVSPPKRGCHLITDSVLSTVNKELRQYSVGIANVFVKHTSCSITINENADPTVRRDMEVALNKLVPASWNHDGSFQHTDEGDDDMPGHVKSSMFGVSLNIPIKDGRLSLGTWQVFHFSTHRTHFSHMSHPTFPISHLLFLLFRVSGSASIATRAVGVAGTTGG